MLTSRNSDGYTWYPCDRQPKALIGRACVTYLRPVCDSTCRKSDFTLVTLFCREPEELTDRGRDLLSQMLEKA